MPFSHRWVSNWVWACLIFHCFDTYGLRVGGVWHYSSFKYRILDCVSRSNFILPHGETAHHKSRNRPLVIYHISETKKKKKSGTTEFSTQLERLKRFTIVRCDVFFKQRDKCTGAIASRYSQLGVLWRNLTTVKSTFKHTVPRAIIRATPLLKVSHLSLYYCESVSVHQSTYITGFPVKYFHVKCFRFLEA